MSKLHVEREVLERLELWLRWGCNDEAPDNVKRAARAAWRERIDALLAPAPAADPWEVAALAWWAVENEAGTPQDCAAHFRAVHESEQATTRKLWQGTLDALKKAHAEEVGKLEHLLSKTHDNTTRTRNPNAMQTYAELGKAHGEIDKLRAQLRASGPSAREIAEAVRLRFGREGVIDSDSLRHDWRHVLQRAVREILDKNKGEPEVTEQEIAESRAAYEEAANIDGGQVSRTIPHPTHPGDPNYCQRFPVPAEPTSGAEIIKAHEVWKRDYRNAELGQIEIVPLNGPAIKADLARRFDEAVERERHEGERAVSRYGKERDEARSRVAGLREELASARDAASAENDDRCEAVKEADEARSRVAELEGALGKIRYKIDDLFDVDPRSPPQSAESLLEFLRSTMAEARAALEGA